MTPTPAEVLREVATLATELEEGGCSCGCSGRKGRVLREIDLPVATCSWMRDKGLVAVPEDLVNRLRTALAPLRGLKVTEGHARVRVPEHLWSFFTAVSDDGDEFPAVLLTTDVKT